jgi:hypothetical protein
VCEFASLASKEEGPNVVKHLHFLMEYTAAEVKRYKDLQGEILCRSPFKVVLNFTFTIQYQIFNQIR